MCSGERLDGRRIGGLVAALASSSENPMIALSGVRSSWLMAARKSLFAALAAAARR